MRSYGIRASVPPPGASRGNGSLEMTDEIVARTGPQRLDLVKLDIEESEVDALDGARMVISGFRPSSCSHRARASWAPPRRGGRGGIAGQPGPDQGGSRADSGRA